MELTLGAKVYLNDPLPYLKTTDPMPMLRPSDLVSQDEVGEVVGVRAMKTVEVRFRRGTFLVPVDKLTIKTSLDNKA
tara:strand:- start:165 stop:395 length:231 start_codon:yes stop_codon:yes gene_type:complete